MSLLKNSVIDYIIRLYSLWEVYIMLLSVGLVDGQACKIPTQALVTIGFRRSHFLNDLSIGDTLMAPLGVVISPEIGNSSRILV